MTERNGKRKPRSQNIRTRIPELGYYIIVTDTQETEQNYIKGLRSSIPKESQDKIVIVVSKTNTANLVNQAREISSLHPQYAQPWIIFDRDKVVGFDQIVEQAEKCGVKVGWSNPCIEIWFSAYFGEMPTYLDSVACCKGFAQEYKSRTKHPYSKADSDIYKKLCKYGDEQAAIKLAHSKALAHLRNGNEKPSDNNPGTTLNILVDEIKSKVK